MVAAPGSRGGEEEDLRPPASRTPPEVGGFVPSVRGAGSNEEGGGGGGVEEKKNNKKSDGDDSDGSKERVAGAH
ncbi:unnamed protein product [Lampetra planeri]